MRKYMYVMKYTIQMLGYFVFLPCLKAKFKKSDSIYPFLDAEEVHM